MSNNKINNMIFDDTMTIDTLHELILEFLYNLNNMSSNIEKKYVLTFKKVRLCLNMTLVDFDTLYNEYTLLLNKNHNINLELLK